MSTVKIKGIGGKQGLVFIVDLNKDIEDISKSLTRLLKETSEYFSKNAISLSFIETHREDDFSKMRAVQKLILESGFLISSNVGVVENTIVKERSRTRILRKSLRAGNKFTFDGNIVLFGDVNPGAQVEITGSFVCIGSVFGVVHAGQSLGGDCEYEDEEICIYARNIDSPQIKVRNELIQNIKDTNWLHVVD